MQLLAPDSTGAVDGRSAGTWEPPYSIYGFVTSAVFPGKNPKQEREKRSLVPTV